MTMKIKIFVSLLLPLFFAGTLFSAEPTDSGQLLQESESPLMPTPQPRTPRIDVSVPKASAKENGVRIQFEGFRFTGNTVFTNDELSIMLSPFIGLEMNLEEMNLIIKNITKSYRSKGYFLATAVIPPQTIKKGEPITVEILEGNLSEIEITTEAEKSRVPKSLLDSYARRVSIGKPVEDKSLSSLAMFANDLPGMTARIVLEPGAERGSSRAQLKMTEGKPYGFYIDTDNYGNYSTGYYRAGLGLELYSPLKLGDHFKFRAQSSSEGDTVNLKAGYSVPISHYATRIGFDYQWVEYELGRDFESLDANGKAEGYILSLEQPLVRNRSLIMDVTLSGELTRLDDRIRTLDISNKRHTTTVNLGFSGIVMDTFIAGAATKLSAKITRGDLEFDDDAARSNDQGSGGLNTDGLYHKFTLSLSRNQLITNRISLYLGGYGQISDKNLDTSEQLYIGGPTAVRAYPVGEASADEGYVVTAEIRYLLGTASKLPGNFQLIAFFDDGRARIDHDPVVKGSDNRRHLAGLGAGFNWFEYDNFSVKTSIAWRTTDEATSDTKREDSPTTYFQLVKRF